MKKDILKVTCLSCDWSSSDKHDIENANWYGECLSVCSGQEVLLRWDFEDGSMSVTNSRSGDSVETQVGA
jgi:hypothetical protein